jgi:hypothetical protein
MHNLSIIECTGDRFEMDCTLHDKAGAHGLLDCTVQAAYANFRLLVLIEALSGEPNPHYSINAHTIKTLQ